MQMHASFLLKKKKKQMLYNFIPIPLCSLLMRARCALLEEKEWKRLALNELKKGEYAHCPSAPAFARRGKEPKKRTGQGAGARVDMERKRLKTFLMNLNVALALPS